MDTPVSCQRIDRAQRLADLVIMGSHCIGLDIIIERLATEGLLVRALNVGSTKGLAAAKRGECGLAPIHLMDPVTGDYARASLIDRLLEGVRPPGYWSQPKSHNAVAAAVALGRADWGVTIDSVARRYALGFLPVQDEHYDFVVPSARADRPAVRRFRAVLGDASLRETLARVGFGF